MTIDEFIIELKKIGITPTKKNLNQLDKYYNYLINQNKYINLTRIVEKKDVYLKHFYDSLTIVKIIDLNNINTLCDVGTGAGFPGIVIKIFYPQINVDLVESITKKANFLNNLIKELELTNINVINDRAENLNNKYDVVVSRAVANIEKLPNYTMHLLNNNGKFIAMKARIDNELTNEVKTKLEKKYKIVKIEQFNLPIENQLRTLVIMQNK